MTRLKLTLLLFAILPVFAETPKAVIVNAVTDRYRPVAFDQQKLTGLLASRIRANSEGYLEHMNAEAQSSTASIQFAGAFLDAAANAYEYSRHDRLRTVMDRVAKQLLSTPAPNESTEGSVDLSTSAYDLLGLLAYYRVTGNDNAFAACKKIGDLLVKKAAGEHAVSELDIVLDPLVQLYRYTGDERYSNLSRSIAAAYKQSSQSADVFTGTKLRALIGLLNFYRLSGDESYFRIAQAGWTAASQRVSVTGTPFVDAQRSELSDSCVTAAWVELTLNLLRITGDPRYGQQLERTIYNQLFAFQDPKTGAAFSSAQFNGSKTRESSENLCAANEARAISIIPSVVWGRWGNGIALLLYAGGRATLQLRRRATVQLYSEAAYPESGEILLHVEPSRNVQFPLRLRVPDWARKLIVDVGESHLMGEPGDFLTLNREWKRGDTVKIAMEMTVRVIEGAPQHAEEIAIQRGPQILALGKTLNPEIEGLSAAGPVSLDPSRLTVTPQSSGSPTNWAGDSAYTIAGEYQGKVRTLVLTPFADAITYTVWMKKPAASSGAT